MSPPRGKSAKCSFCGQLHKHNFHLLKAANGLKLCNYCVVSAYYHFESRRALPGVPTKLGASPFSLGFISSEEIDRTIGSNDDDDE